MASNNTKTLITHDSKGNLTGSESLGGKMDIPTANPFFDNLVERAQLAPQISKTLPIALAYEAYQKSMKDGSPVALEVVHLSGAETSKLLKESLKTKYPDTKFSVRWGGYAGGGSIRVEWLDGPSRKEVDELTDAFQGSTFDGMQDLKEYKSAVLMRLPSNLNPSNDPVLVKFGSDYVFTDRYLSPKYESTLSVIAQTILDHNQNSQGQILGDRLGDYAPLGSEYGTFQGGNAHALLRWLSERVSPAEAIRATN